MNESQVDVAIIGAGMVGATLASLLLHSGFSVALVEAHAPQPFDSSAATGLRVSAISPGSAAILEQAGAWQRVCEQRLRPFRRMQVEAGMESAPLRFDAPVYNLERLGTIVENDLLLWSLWQVVNSGDQLALYCPDLFADIQLRADGHRVTLNSGKVISAALVIGADGPNSRVRRALGIQQQYWTYNQQGLVAVISKQKPNPGVAWQRFLPGGPLAFLPLADGSSSIVWTRPSVEAERLLKLTTDEFMQELEVASSGWLGQVVACGPRAAFPLSMRLSRHYASQGVVLLGDAAHVVHPLAGQGVNLGFADAAALTQTLIAARRSGAGIGSDQVLEPFDRWRRSESQLMSFGMHAIHGLFSSDAVAPLRRIGIAVVKRSWTLRDRFARQAAGLGGNSPLLARGVELQDLLHQP